MSRRYKSDAQANAEAMIRRELPYSEPHEASWTARFGGIDRPMTTKVLIAELLRCLGEQTPDRLHEGPDHIDEGGVPAMTGAFLGYLASSDTSSNAVDEYRKPLHAALRYMKANPGKHRWWARIAERIILASEPPVLAAMAEGSHEYEAARTANEALSELYRRITPEKMYLGKTTTAA